ncbi:hypothetical protein O181_099362 [Austropuccinia psidii MF-1]|uniref:Uncharacterized protein n=1 Tax=Austropuccinia psidii MF-1 TaxID=1389203 RepID=A0A9Q3JC52_9BASI|nr:hypothetical protein [Austropuccinia psidii MF-1]
MPIFNVQPKTMDPSTSDPIPSSLSRQNTQISIPDLTAIVSPTYPNNHSCLVIKEYKGEDGKYLIADDSGLGVDDNTPPKRRKLAGKRQHIQLNVYDYFEKLNPSGELVEAKGNFQFIYKCQHCSVKLGIIGRNTSNLNKHRGRCCGQFNTWASKAPGSVDPNMGAKIAAEEQDSILKQLVETLVAIQVSFLIFETPHLLQVLQ